MKYEIIFKIREEMQNTYMIESSDKELYIYIRLDDDEPSSPTLQKIVFDDLMKNNFTKTASIDQTNIIIKRCQPLFEDTDFPDLMSL